jgi:hypothetical protein
MQAGANKQAFFKVKVTDLAGIPLNDATVYLYNMSTNPATFLGILALVPTGNGIYGSYPGTTYGDCLAIPTAGDAIIEAIASRQGATARIMGVTLSQHISSCP